MLFAKNVSKTLHVWRLCSSVAARKLHGLCHYLGEFYQPPTERAIVMEFWSDSQLH